jgi:hypothetical protein
MSATSRGRDSTNQCRRYRRVRKSFEGPLATRGPFKDLRRNALSFCMLGKLLRETITRPRQGHLIFAIVRSLN